MENIIELLICNKCKENKPATFEFFYRSKKTKTGYKQQCKLCIKAKNKQWRLNNPEKQKEINKRNNHDWYWKNRDKALHANKKWRKNNPEKRIQINLRWWKNNREDLIKKNKKWKTEHPESHRHQNSKRRSIGVGLRRTDKETQEYISILLKDTCSYCGSKDKITMDHITPISAGGLHHWSNLTAACSKCNGSKHIKTMLDFLKYRRIIL